MTSFQKYLLISLIAAVLNAALLVVFFVPRFDHTDSREYIATAKYILGYPDGWLDVKRILKPLPIFTAVPFVPLLGEKNSFLPQNLIFYFLSTWLIFLLVYRLYHNAKQAFYGAVLYIGAYPMLVYGLAPLTDIPGWFFYLLSVWIALNFLVKPQFKTAILSGFVAGFGMLFKENLGAAPIFFTSLVFLAVKLPIREKLKYIFIFGASFIFFPLVNSIIIYNLYSYSYLDWFKSGGIRAAGLSGLYMVTFSRIIVEMGRVLLIGWVFVLWGIFKEFSWKNIDLFRELRRLFPIFSLPSSHFPSPSAASRFSNGAERAKILLAFIPPSLSFFLWSFPHNRMAFIAAPLLVSLASFGLLRKYKNHKMNIFIESALLFLYIAVNYFILEFLLRYGVFLRFGEVHV